MKSAVFNKNRDRASSKTIKTEKRLVEKICGEN
jgi:hypothetical protein